MKRPATAVAACASLLVGAFLPLAFSNDAQAAPKCSTQSAQARTAGHHVAAAQRKVKKARTQLAVARKHHAPVKTVKAKRGALRAARVDLRYAKLARKHYLAQLAACQGQAMPQGTATPKPTATPTVKPTSTATAKPTATASSTPAGNPLSDVIGQLITALSGAGAPAQLTDALKQLQSVASMAPAGFDPAAYQTALTNALAQVQAEIQAGIANPQSMTVTTVVDDIIDPIVASLNTAGVPGLPALLTTLQTTLDPLLAQLPGLGALTGGLPLP